MSSRSAVFLVLACVGLSACGDEQSPQVCHSGQLMLAPSCGAGLPVNTARVHYEVRRPADGWRAEHWVPLDCANPAPLELTIEGYRAADELVVVARPFTTTTEPVAAATEVVVSLSETCTVWRVTLTAHGETVDANRAVESQDGSSLQSVDAGAFQDASVADAPFEASPATVPDAAFDTEIDADQQLRACGPCEQKAEGGACTTKACGRYACDQTAGCLTTCTSDDGCAEGNSCWDASCKRLVLEQLDYLSGVVAFAADAEGNRYVAGSLVKSTRIGGRDFLVRGLVPDALLVKLSTDGQPLWAWQLGDSGAFASKPGMGAEIIRALVQDEEGNLFLVGQFTHRGRSNVFASDGESETPLSHAGEIDSDIFILSVTSDGELRFVRSFGNTFTNGVKLVTGLSDGGLFLLGDTRGSLQLDDVTLEGPTDAAEDFVARLDGQGHVRSAKLLGTGASVHGVAGGPHGEVVLLRTTSALGGAATPMLQRWNEAFEVMGETPLPALGPIASDADGHVFAFVQVAQPVTLGPANVTVAPATWALLKFTPDFGVDWSVPFQITGAQRKEHTLSVDESGAPVLALRVQERVFVASRSEPHDNDLESRAASLVLARLSPEGRLRTLSSFAQTDPDTRAVAVQAGAFGIVAAGVQYGTLSRGQRASQAKGTMFYETVGFLAGFAD